METPEYKQNITAIPQVSNVTIQTPEETKSQIPNPQHSPTDIPKPKFGHLENVVKFGNEEIQLKPTKLKYQRDKTASFYRILQQLPLTDILAFQQGMLDQNKSSDKLLFDWLIAATDDPQLVKRNYDDIDSETVESILKIFCRLNHIEEKDERKNRRAQEKNP